MIWVWVFDLHDGHFLVFVRGRGLNSDKGLRFAIDQRYIQALDLRCLRLGGGLERKRLILSGAQKSKALIEEDLHLKTIFPDKLQGAAVGDAGSIA